TGWAAPGQLSRERKQSLVPGIFREKPGHQVPDPLPRQSPTRGGQTSAADAQLFGGPARIVRLTTLETRPCESVTYSVAGPGRRPAGMVALICLDVTGQGTANGTQVEIWDCDGAANQHWSRQFLSSVGPNK